MPTTYYQPSTRTIAEFHVADETSEYDSMYISRDGVSLGTAPAAETIRIIAEDDGWLMMDNRDLIDSETADVIRAATVDEAILSFATDTAEGHILVDGRRCYVA
jgi:hypothetical protein